MNTSFVQRKLTKLANEMAATYYFALIDTLP